MRRTLIVAGCTFFLGCMANRAYAERQPHMRDALASLHSALESLEKASSDKGGHRVKAMEATRLAIDEVKAGIDYAELH